jgi:transcription initiation factor IIE alpha subunit
MDMPEKKTRLYVIPWCKYICEEYFNKGEFTMADIRSEYEFSSDYAQAILLKLKANGLVAIRKEIPPNEYHPINKYRITEMPDGRNYFGGKKKC